MPYHKKHKKSFRLDGQLNAFLTYLVKTINSLVAKPIGLSGIMRAALTVLLYDIEFRDALLQKIICLLQGEEIKR